MQTSLFLWMIHAYGFLMAGRGVTTEQVSLAAAIDEAANRFTITRDPKFSRALAVAVTWYESGGRVNAVSNIGDGGMCAFQITPGWESLLEDAEECAFVGVKMLAKSQKIDPVHPIAVFARGGAWRTAEAQRLSDEREGLADFLYVMIK